jgi:hypothetical protein
MAEIPPEHKHLFPDVDTGETKEQLRRQLARCRENLTVVLLLVGLVVLPFLLHAVGLL